MKKERDLLPDILRGFAILMVVYGHCIQEGNGYDFSTDMSYFDDKIYQFIYSFHMPLFALIAGYFACSSLSKADSRKSRISLLLRRVSTYFIPIFVWTMFECIREAIINVNLGYLTYTPVSFLSMFLGRLITNHWFLWSMIICFIIVFVVRYCLNDNLIAYGIIYLSLFFIPDGYNFHAYKYLLTFYVTAYLFRKNREVLTSLLSKVYERLPLSVLLWGLIFIILFLPYRREAFIYVSGYRITKNIWYKQLIIDIYRTVIGFAGSIFFILLFKLLTKSLPKYQFPLFSHMGRYSLGIYLISGYSTILLFRQITDSLSYSALRNILETVIVAAMSLILSMIIGKVPYLKKIIGK